MIYLLDPFILKHVINYIFQGYELNKIIEEYEQEIDLDAVFINEIVNCHKFAIKNLQLRKYQKECLDSCLSYYESSVNNKNYQIRWCCGLGKTKTACSIVKLGNFNSICIGLPSILLLDQFYQEISKFYPNVTIFKMGGKTDDGDSVMVEVSLNSLQKYLLSDAEYKIVLTTYHSSKKIVSTGFEFDICVADEAHHLESKKQKLFSEFLSIKSKKRIFLSATPNLNPENNLLYSFENSVCFQGEYNQKSLKWAIAHKYVVDYRIIILDMHKIDIRELDFLTQKYGNLEMVLAAFSAVKAIYQGISNKILVYCNKVKNAKHVENIIDELLDIHNATKTILNPQALDLEIGNFELNGTNSMREREQTMNNFKRLENGIISSVQIFGEGFDYPELDTVIFAEKMSSDIRIIQSGLRPCRRDSKNLNKIANIIIPIQESDISKPKQILTKLKTIDEVGRKIAILNTRSFNKKSLENYFHRGKSILDKNVNRIMNRIQLQILDTTNLTKIKIPDVTNSKVKKCFINGTEVVKKNFNQIFLELFNILGKTRMQEVSIMNFKYHKKEHRVKGYIWYEHLKMALPPQCSNNICQEIVRICQKEDIKLNLFVKWKDESQKNIRIENKKIIVN